MTRKLLLPLALLFTLLSCSDSNDELLDKLQDAVETAEAGENGYQVIRMDSLTDFEWETMYFFQATEDKKVISEKIGFKWEGATVPDSHQRLLFVNNGQVVSFVDYNFYEFPLNVYGCNTDRWVYPRSRSAFATFKYCVQDSVVYPLIPVACVSNLREMMGHGCPEGEGATAAAE